MLPDVILREVTREDVTRLYGWLQDEEVSASWYGIDSSGEPIHVGYSPRQLMEAPAEEWEQLLASLDRKVFSIYMTEEQHIGEGQLVLEREVGSAHVFILIGVKALWYQHYGSAAMIKLLDEAFNTYGVHRVWLAVPEYNQPALHMCEHIGFVLEGRLRGRQLRSGQWYDSLSMGLLADEYSRRRGALLSDTGVS